MNAEKLFNAFDALDTELIYEARAGRFVGRSTLRRAAIAASFVVLLALCGLIYGLFIAPSAYLYLDSRDSCIVTLNARGRVLSVRSDADHLPVVVGKRCDTAARELIDAMCESSAIDQAENTLIIGYNNITPTDVDRILTAAAEAVEDRQIEPAIVMVDCEHQDGGDKDTSPAVERILSLLAENGIADPSQLRGLSANDLNLLLCDCNITSPDVTVSGTASDAALIGREAAVAKALSLSSFRDAQAKDICLRYGACNGKLIYLATLTEENKTESFFISASGGTVERAVKIPPALPTEAIASAVTATEAAAEGVSEAEPPTQPTFTAAPEEAAAPTASETLAASPAAPTAESDERLLSSVTMKEFSFVTMTPPQSALPCTVSPFFEGQYFGEPEDIETGNGTVTLITSEADWQAYLSAHAFPYLDADGAGIPSEPEASFFDTNCIAAIDGAFVDASYYADLAAMHTDGSTLYIDVGIRYGERRDSPCLCRTVSLYIVENSSISGADSLIVY